MYCDGINKCRFEIIPIDDNKVYSSLQKPKCEENPLLLIETNEKSYNSKVFFSNEEISKEKKISRFYFYAHVDREKVTCEITFVKKDDFIDVSPFFNIREGEFDKEYDDMIKDH